ncbi:MAG TPA: 30S ribosomal protein S16 [Thermoclostridium sp.]|nr:30S ribosomal protein S16 [Thermoclostridium sp.]
MAVKMRLKRIGAKKKPFYRIIIADARAPRDGKFIDQVGTYNPLTDPSEVKFDEEKAKDWLKKGVQPTNTVKRLLKNAGITD